MENIKDISRSSGELARTIPGIGVNGLDLLISSFTEHNPEFSTEDVLSWLKKLNRESVCDVRQVPLAKLEKWQFDENRNLRHESGKFFSIEGIRVDTNAGLGHAPVPHWFQPIINQPEIGILGIVCQKQNGLLKFLMQAKIEPGNVNKVQLSPTVQATKSNYTQVHKGLRPLFLDYFIDLEHRGIIVDQLQSEQGARFLKKRNRNVCIELGQTEKIQIPDHFCWLTLGQIKRLMEHDNLINMDARTVLSCTQLPAAPSSPSRTLKGRGEYGSGLKLELLDSLLCREGGLHGTEEIISWFTGLKMLTSLDVTRCGVKDLDRWRVNEYDISHVDGKYFQVIGVQVHIGTREVTQWCQPLIKQRESGIIGFIARKIKDVYHFLVQAKLEAGNFDILEMAPTVQCITGSYTKPEYSVPYLDYFLARKPCRILYDTVQSEEGGRFFQEQNRYAVVEVDESFPDEVEKRYIWMTMGQIKEFIKFNNYFNVEARSLIASISPI